MGFNRVRIIRFISLTLLLVMVYLSVGPGVARADPGWYDAAWAYRKKITIDNTKVAATLTDFPVLISLSTDTELAGNAQDDGDDILFTTTDGITKINHEIETFNGTSGQLVTWVKVPGLSSAADTDIYIYYGNSGAGNQENPTFVWDSNYQMVQHLEETTGGANAIQDSTSNTNHGTDNNSPTLNAAGKINGADGFDGSDDYISVADSNSLDITGNITLEAWVKTTNNALSYQTIMEKRPAVTNYNYYLRLDSGYFRFSFYSGAHRALLDDTTQLSSNVWHHVAATYDNSNIRLYVDGTEAKSGAQTAPLVADTGAFIIGIETYQVTDTNAFSGTVDEVRISDTARSADWLLTSYNNQSSPSGFYSVGSAQAGVPTAVGGVVYPVDKVRILMPWLLLFAVILLAGSGVTFRLRKSA